jgi:hypothetical protein
VGQAIESNSLAAGIHRTSPPDRDGFKHAIDNEMLLHGFFPELQLIDQL